MSRECPPKNPTANRIDARCPDKHGPQSIAEKTGLSQPQFAVRFHIGLARLRDFEQGRSEPDFIVRVFLRMIHEDPAKADRLVKSVERQGISR